MSDLKNRSGLASTIKESVLREAASFSKDVVLAAIRQALPFPPFLRDDAVGVTDFDAVECCLTKPETYDSWLSSIRQRLLEATRDGLISCVQRGSEWLPKTTYQVKMWLANLPLKSFGIILATTGVVVAAGCAAPSMNDVVQLVKHNLARRRSRLCGLAACIRPAQGDASSEELSAGKYLTHSLALPSGYDVVGGWLIGGGLMTPVPEVSRVVVSGERSPEVSAALPSMKGEKTSSGGGVCAAHTSQRQQPARSFGCRVLRTQPSVREKLPVEQSLLIARYRAGSGYEVVPEPYARAPSRERCASDDYIDRCRDQERTAARELELWLATARKGCPPTLVAAGAVRPGCNETCVVDLTQYDCRPVDEVKMPHPPRQVSYDRRWLIPGSKLAWRRVKPLLRGGSPPVGVADPVFEPVVGPAKPDHLEPPKKYYISEMRTPSGQLCLFSPHLVGALQAHVAMRSRTPNLYQTLVSRALAVVSEWKLDPALIGPLVTWSVTLAFLPSAAEEESAKLLAHRGVCSVADSLVSKGTWISRMLGVRPSLLAQTC